MVNKERLGVFEVSEKASSRRESNPGHLACTAQVSWVRFLVTAGLSLSSIFTSKTLISLYSNVRQKFQPLRLRKTLRMGSLLMGRIFHQPLLKFWWHTLCACLVWDWGYHLCVYIKGGGCPVVVAQWQSTDSSSQVSWFWFPVTAGNFTFLYFRLKNI